MLKKLGDLMNESHYSCSVLYDCRYNCSFPDVYNVKKYEFSILEVACMHVYIYIFLEQVVYVLNTNMHILYLLLNTCFSVQ